MDLLGSLNPTAQQVGQNQAMTAQQQKNAQDLATMLQKEGQTQGKFTSPWQVAGQWAQTIAGKNKQGQANQAYQDLNSLNDPGQPASTAGTTLPGQTAPVPGTAGPAAPGIPSGATPATPSSLPWSGADAGTFIDPMMMTG